MAAPKVRHWYDANAPVLTSTLGSINNVLDKVLVDGYDTGNFPALGWTKEYEDTVNHKTAFRNSATNGTGAYLQVQQHHATNDYEYNLTARMFEAMSDVDTGTSPFQNENRLSRFGHSTNNTYTYPWIIVGDDLRFHLFTWPDCLNVADLAALRGHASVGMVSYNFFGDGIKLRPDDSFCSFIGMRVTSYVNCLLSSSVILGNYTPDGYSSNCSGTPRKIDGTVTPTSVSSLQLFSNLSGYSSFPAYPHLSNLNLTKAYFNVGQHDTGSNSGLSRSRRATIPGLRWVFHRYSGFTQLEEITDGSTYLIVITGSTSNGPDAVVAIDIGTSWGEE